MTKSDFRRKGFLQLTPPSHSTLSLREVVARTQAGTEARILEERKLLMGLLALADCLFPYTAQNHLSGMATATKGPPTQIINQENVPDMCPQDNRMEVIP